MPGLNSFKSRNDCQSAECCAGGLPLKLCKSLCHRIRTTDIYVDLWFTCYRPVFACLGTVVCRKATANGNLEFGQSDITLCTEFID